MPRSSRFLAGFPGFLALLASQPAYALMEDPGVGAPSGNAVTYFFQYVSAIYTWAAGVSAGICVVWGVWAGLMMIMAGADQGKFSGAKNHLVAALTGLLIILFLGVILRTINPFSFQTYFVVPPIA